MSTLMRDLKQEHSTSYRVPRHLGPIALRLDGNEGQLVSEEIFGTLEELGPSELRTYPSTHVLERDIAEVFGVAPEQVLVTAGADDGLLRMCRAFLSPGKNLVLPEPTFEMLRRFAGWCFAEVRSVLWDTPEYPLKRVMDSVNSDTSLIAVVSPNNPTGGVITSDGLRKLSQTFPSRMLMVDCAYAEFSDEDITQTALSLPNAVVFRTFSKALGLAGLRVGFAMGSVETINKLRAVGMPYPVSAPSLRLARAGLERRNDSADYLDQVKMERTALTSWFQTNGMSVMPSQGNFVLARMPDALWWRDALAGFGIGVRVWLDNPQLKDAVRITCPGEKTAFFKLMSALETILLPQAILFDIDGVLADVSQSYRAAIVATAAEFGVSVSNDDIERLKRVGNANNDWRLTQCLISENGVDVPFERVKQTFEAMYWGRGDIPALFERESLIGDVEQLQRLAMKLPIAAVTGRPKRDALMFLKRFNLLESFSAVITMEDAPAKPHPAPVKEALKCLDVERAWMLGDTRDDIDAARGARVLPIGVLTPTQENTSQNREALLKAGAARVFNQWTEVESYLP